MPDVTHRAEARPAAHDSRTEAPLFAALDLGTNNCRLLIARRARSGFRIVEAFSRIVRLGEGLSRTGEMSDAAMDRAVSALGICAEKIRRREVTRMRAVATQACRSARNGQVFLERVERETGLKLQIIDPSEEARLAVAGCTDTTSAPCPACAPIAGPVLTRWPASMAKDPRNADSSRSPSPAASQCPTITRQRVPAGNRRAM